MTLTPLLLSDPSPCLRRLVLRELLSRPEDDQEVRELVTLCDADPLVAGLLKLQGSDGSWDADSVPGSARGGRIQATSQALTRLGYLGIDPDHPAVRRGAEYLFAQQRNDGAWDLPRNASESNEPRRYRTIPLQTAIPLRGLASCGQSMDPRAERAYDWLLTQRLPDGAWPTGIASGNYGYVGGYRRLAHSRWGCRSNTTGVLACLALHPERRKGYEARRALDLLLGRETREKHTIGFEVARTLGTENTHGFLTYYARFDSAQVLDLCWRIGATLEDDRIVDLVDFIAGLRGTYGLWQYERNPQVTRWLSFDILRSLSHLHESGDWLSLEPRTPFRPYFKRLKRY